MASVPNVLSDPSTKWKKDKIKNVVNSDMDFAFRITIPSAFEYFKREFCFVLYIIILFPNFKHSFLSFAIREIEAQFKMKRNRKLPPKNITV